MTALLSNVSLEAAELNRKRKGTARLQRMMAAIFLSVVLTFYASFSVVLFYPVSLEERLLGQVDELSHKHLYDDALFVLDRILETQPNNAMYNRKHDSLVFLSFKKWLARGGATFSKIHPVLNSTDGRGIFATEEISPGETLVNIPYHLMLTSALVESSSIGQTIVQSGIPRSLHTIFAVFLANERRKPSSTWQPFLRMLPQSFDFMPSSSNAAVGRFLNGSHVRQKVNQRQLELLGETKSILDVLPYLSQKDVIWALHVSVNRALNVGVKGVEMSVIVPFGNSLRHTLKSPTSWGFLESKQAFTVRALQNFHRGDEIRHGFSEKSAGDYFVDYGFVPTEVSDLDEFSVTFQNTNLSERHPFIGSWDREFVLTTKFDEALQRCLSFLRIREEPLESWARMRQSLLEVDTGFFSDLNDIASEQRAWKALRTEVNKKVQKYKLIEASVVSPELLAADEALAFSLMKVEIRVAKAILLSIENVLRFLQGDQLSMVSEDVILQEYREKMLELRQARPLVEHKNDTLPLEALDQLQEWLEKKRPSSDISLTAIRTYNAKEDNRGLHATVDIQPGDVVARVPLSNILSSKVVIASDVGIEIGKRSIEVGISLTQHTLLATFLATEAMKEDSEWSAWIQTLPTSYGLPLEYSPEQLQKLQASYTIGTIEKARENFELEYTNLKKVVPDIAERIGHDSFMQALYAVNSRNFGFENLGGESIHLLVPWADMFNNNGAESQTTWDFNEDLCEFQVIATVPIASGDAISIEYGDKSNGEFFVTYGFALEKNKFNDARFKLGEKAFILQADLQSLLKKNGFFQYLRHMQKKMFPERSVYETDIAALRELNQAAELGLREFPTTILEDELLLSEATEFRERMMIIVRLSEKKVFRFWLISSMSLLRQMEEDSTTSIIDAVSALEKDS